MKRITLLAAVLAGLLVGCDGNPGSGGGNAGANSGANAGAGSGGGALTIAAIPKGTSHEFWQSIKAGVYKAAGELKDKGTQVDIIWQGPAREDDRSAQIDVVERMVARGVNGIVLAPLDDSALRKPVALANQRGIPVVIFDSALKGKAPDDFASFVATDNHEGGRLGGEHMAKLLDGKGKVILLRYMEGSASTDKREQGFLDAIKKYPGIEVVSSNQYTGATAADAFTVSENLLAPYKTADGTGLTVDGVFCPCEPVVVGMLRALQNMKLAGKVKFVGFDASKKIVDGLRAGDIDALVVQNPVKMGYLATLTLVDRIHGKPVDAYIDTGVAVVTRDNMTQPAMAELLNPPLERYLK